MNSWQCLEVKTSIERFPTLIILLNQRTFPAKTQQFNCDFEPEKEAEHEGYGAGVANPGPAPDTEENGHQQPPGQKHEIFDPELMRGQEQVAQKWKNKQDLRHSEPLRS